MKATSIYQRLGIPTITNAKGLATRVSGPRLQAVLGPD